LATAGQSTDHFLNERVVGRAGGETIDGVEQAVVVAFHFRLRKSHWGLSGRESVRNKSIGGMKPEDELSVDDPLDVEEVAFFYDLFAP
jgi:hypothetical protein